MKRVCVCVCKINVHSEITNLIINLNHWFNNQIKIKINQLKCFTEYIKNTWTNFDREFLMPNQRKKK